MESIIGGAHMYLETTLALRLPEYAELNCLINSMLPHQVIHQFDEDGRNLTVGRGVLKRLSPLVYFCQIISTSFHNNDNIVFPQYFERADLSHIPLLSSIE
jgi:hypothetical protein